MAAVRGEWAAWERGVDGVARLLDAPLRALEHPLGPPGCPDRRALILDDRFALFEVLAASGRATVFGGVELGPTIAVALKLVLPTPGFAVYSRELERERDVLTALAGHEHIVELRGYGRAAALPYLVTRRMSGGSLDRWMGDEPGLLARVQVVADASAGLAAAASLGIAHGDVKPQNLLVSGEGRGCVCDWGSASGLDEDPGPRLTTSLFCGPGLRAPTGPGDVFSLGLCLAFAVRGWHGLPSAGADPQAWLIRATEGIEDPTLAELIGRCVDPSPSARPSAAELARRLRSFSPVEL